MQYNYLLFRSDDYNTFGSLVNREKAFSMEGEYGELYECNNENW